MIGYKRSTKEEQSTEYFKDFLKTFHSVPYKILLLKLKAYGIDGKLLGWIEMFLLNKQHRVVINGSASA